ncbi:MAG: HD family hydrolase [Nitrososphaeria archaeon]
MSLNNITDIVSILKNTPRTGWLQCGIPPYEAETVAEHTFEVVSILMTFALSSNKVDTKRMLIMGVVHDFTESVSGDIPKGFTEVISQRIKKEAEVEIMKSLAKLSKLPEIIKIFEEYERRETDESILVKVADLVSTLRQAKTYSKRGYKVDNIIEGYRKELFTIINRIKDKNLRSMVKNFIEGS